ncbi:MULTISPECIES: GNAT family N-acetyltransferase [unclassified Dinoroseobacter]|uniref:GNAT family N-acetyltransferase n=1 Tax=unclassified Dinoroseobacter TaxID=2620028 RepID=UPI003C7AF0A4
MNINAPPPIEYRPIRADDHRAVSILVDTSFEGPGESRLLQALRDESAMELELVAIEKGHVIGHIAFPRLITPEGWIALAPLTVRSDKRRQGVGAALVREGIDMLRQRHVPAILVLGDPSYYERFGFSVKGASRLSTAYPRNNLMLLPFQPGLGGERFDVRYPTAFFRGLGDSRS